MVKGDKVYLSAYCSKCAEGMKMVLEDGTILCPQCGSIVYSKGGDK